MISGHEKFRFGYGNLGEVRSENLENLEFWKVVRMSHPIAKNGGMPRGIILQMPVSPNMPYRAKNIKFQQLSKTKKIPWGPLLLSALGQGLLLGNLSF